MKPKIFLSHSSHDKEYVRPIAEALGKDLCVYDEMCFEKGVGTLDEILNGLDQTSLFVLFISDTSLESDWVKKEVAEAENRIWDSEKRLEQVFPIIIDPIISYADKRIPSFLKNKFQSYNIQHISSHKIAYRKIISQYNKLLLKANHKLEMGYSYGIFYGRLEEKADFQKCFDNGQRIKCLVVSGIGGIGKRSYIVDALRSTGILPDYYEPPVITMDADDDITSLILKLSELGFGKMSYDEIIALPDMDARISTLTKLFQEIQNCNEHVIIYDKEAIIGYEKEIKYWFDCALKQIRPEITVSIASSVTLSKTYLARSKSYIGIELSTLKPSEWKGLLREYGKSIGIVLELEDIDYFKDVITGYPPQVRYCADIVSQEGLENVKRRYMPQIADFSSDNIANVVNVALESVKNVKGEVKDKNLGKGLLSYMCNYGIIPMQTLADIMDLNPSYVDYYNRFRALTICRNVGAKNDLVVVNPAVADFVQRNIHYENEDIKEYLKKRYNLFLDKLKKEKLDDEDYETLKFFLKQTLKDGMFYENYLYSTIYISAIRELYDSGKYKQVIEIVSKLKENRSFERFDEEIQEQIQRIYCRTLARQMDPRFDEEITWYKERIKKGDRYYTQLHFLCGFMFRQKGLYSKAIDEFNMVLSKSPNNSSARRELVAAYQGMEEYDTCKQFAEYNFQRQPSNRYYIQGYFESLIHTSDEEHHSELANVMNALDSLYKVSIQKDAMYYEIKAKYEFYVKHNSIEARRYLEKGQILNPNTPFLIIAEFDMYDSQYDIEGMQTALKKLKNLIDGGAAVKTEIAHKRRMIILDAHCNKSITAIKAEIDSFSGWSEHAREMLKERVERIAIHSGK